jgi:hypothetical protein
MYCTRPCRGMAVLMDAVSGGDASQLIRAKEKPTEPFFTREVHHRAPPPRSGSWSGPPA